MTQTPNWRIAGDWFDNCSCAIACPCTFAQPPDNDFCESVLFWHIKRGYYGDVNLDDLCFVRVGRWDGDLWAGKVKGAAGLLIDERADERQAEILPTIFGGQAGGFPAQVAELFTGGRQVTGVERASITFEIAPDHRKLYPFYAKCWELNVPIQMQVGQSMIYAKDFPCQSVGRPISLDPVACDFPELKLIGIHVGIPWHEEMIAMAWKHANVYIGCDAHRPKYWPESFTHYINSFGQDKVIFGTDYPVLPFKRSIEDIDGLGLKPEVRRKLMRDNTIRIYQLD